ESLGRDRRDGGSQALVERSTGGELSVRRSELPLELQHLLHAPAAFRESRTHDEIDAERARAEADEEGESDHRVEEWWRARRTPTSALRNRNLLPPLEPYSQSRHAVRERLPRPFRGGPGRARDARRDARRGSDRRCSARGRAPARTFGQHGDPCG